MDGEEHRAEDAFGAVLRRHRIRVRMTQERLAELAGLSARTIRDLEAGRVRYPRPESVRRLGAALGLAGDELERFTRLGRVDYWHARERRVEATRPDTLIGRDRELELLDRLALAARAAGPGQLVTVTGPAGTGKTALLRFWARRAGGLFPGGVHHLDPACRRPARPGPAGAVSGRPAASLRDALVVLDGVRSPADVRVAMRGEPALVLAASRHPLDTLDPPAAAVVEVGPLPLRDAVALLRSVMGEEVDGVFAARLALRCARLPLALRVVGTLAASRPAESLARVVDELAAAPDGPWSAPAEPLGADPDGTLQAVLDWSSRQLPPDLAHLLRISAGDAGG